ncbi:MAG TPA: ATP-binding protein [Terracidiphilus sp.]|jgi:two-component system sensor histidine kinase KdpD|nr:ATP-binding protein [Terracidiphilus sp.]
MSRPIAIAGKEVKRLSGTYISLRSAFAEGRVRTSGRQALLFATECALGIVSVLLVGFLANWLQWLLPVVVLLYLLIVVPVALWCGFWQAAIVSLSAVGVQSYFTSRMARTNPAVDPANPIELFVFILTALVISRLSARVTEHARSSDSWGGQMQDLYEFTRRTLQMNLHVEPGLQLAELVHEIFALEAVVIFDADLHEIYQAGYWNVDPQELAQNVYYFESSDDDPDTGISRRVLRLGNVPIGSIVMRGDTSPLTNNAIASLIAVTFDRYRAFANESRIETERQTEQLRSTVLDSLAHEYKTPLTAIRAASTGLSEMGKLSAGQADLVSLISEQTDLLSDLTTKLLTTARLDADEVIVHAASVGVASLIDEVVASMSERLATMKLAVDVPDENLILCCDRRLMTMLLTQYIDNACKYAIYGTTITIRAVQSKNEVIFSVHSFGPVIPMADRERIFDRYYRSSNSSNRAAGTGIGLSVAKRAATIHNGYVWVTSDQDEGNTFFAAIPAQARKRELQ